MFVVMPVAASDVLQLLLWLTLLCILSAASVLLWGDILMI